MRVRPKHEPTNHREALGSRRDVLARLRFGFVADPFSPAGEVERFGQLARGLREPGILRRAARFNLVTKLMVLLLGLMALMVVFVLVASGVSRL